MCLTLLSDNPKKLISYRQRYGWKVFHYEPVTYRLEFEQFPYNNEFVVPLNRWISSKEPRKAFGKHISYKPRFHIYLCEPIRNPFNYKGESRLRKVLFRYPVATGYQDRQPVVVATMMKVLPVEN